MCVLAASFEIVHALTMHAEPARNCTVFVHAYSTTSKSIYKFVEPSSFVCKLLPQRVCDERDTQPYYRAPHGECHKGVSGRRFVTAEKSATQIPTLTEIDAMMRPENGTGVVLATFSREGNSNFVASTLIHYV